MKLFYDFKRVNKGLKSYSESDHEYLNSSARDEAKCIRDVLEDWFSRYPEEEKKEFLARFQSSDNYQHISASFEIYLHELFTRLGCSIEVHPDIPGDKETHPDFKVTEPDGNKFYLECVTCTDVSHKERGADARLNVVYDIINELESNDFYIGIRHEGTPGTPPPSKELKRKLKHWLRSLDIEIIEENVKEYGDEGLPVLTYVHDGWLATFTAIPRAKLSRNRPVEKVIGLQSYPGSFLNTGERLRDCISKKGSRYGKLDLPLVIAVNACVFHVENIDIMEALFGQEEYIYDSNDHRKKSNFRRKPNGLWYGPKGAQYSRISGIIVGFDVKPWTFGVRPLTLYKNPWAKIPLEGVILTLPTYKLVSESMELNEGMSHLEILELPSCYPGL